jgi:hypothetical protein
MTFNRSGFTGSGFSGSGFRVQRRRRPNKRPVKSKKKLLFHRGARNLRPLRAVGSLSEPEAIGPRTYSPTRRARVYEPEAAPVGER